MFGSYFRPTLSTSWNLQFLTNLKIYARFGQTHAASKLDRFQDLPGDVANPMMRLVGPMVEMARLEPFKAAPAVF